MSRTILCVVTAAVVAVASIALMASRRHVLGSEIKAPAGPGSWKVTLLVTGTGAADLKLWTATPLDFGKQHVHGEIFRSDELLDKPTDSRHPSRRQVVWAPRAGRKPGPFRARYEFYCSTSVAHPTTPMTEAAQTLYAAPTAGQYLQREPGIDGDNPRVASLAKRLTEGIDRSEDQAEALYRHVAKEIANEPSIVGRDASADECLKADSGDAGAKSRLLAALLRNRGLPARLVTGLTLARDSKQVAHVWVEAWLRDQWLPLCPFYQHYGTVPRTYLVFGFGNTPVVRAKNARNLDYAFLVERLSLDAADPARDASLPRRLLLLLSLHTLPPAEQHLVEFLLLLPIAALIVCLFRNVIGLGSFGTFAPALLGLAFREWHAMPGILVFAGIVLTGWVLRRGLERYHLLQVPRMAVMLSLVMLLLIGAIMTASHHSLPPTRYISLFPMVILVSMIERFWTLETEDGVPSSFRTLLCTMLIVFVIALVLSSRALVAHMTHYPETLGIVLALQLLIGRYTGYRLSELYRFRDFMGAPPPPATPRLLHLD